MGLRETIVLAFIGGVAGLILGSGLVTNLNTNPESEAIFVLIFVIVGAYLGWSMGDYKHTRLTSQ